MRFFLIFWTITSRNGYYHSGVYPFCGHTYPQKEETIKLIKHSVDFLEKQRLADTFVNGNLMPKTLALTNIDEITEDDFYEFSDLARQSKDSLTEQTASFPNSACANH